MMDYIPVVDDTKANGGSSVQSRYNGTAPGYESTFGGAVNPMQMFTINLMGLQTDGVPQWSYYPQIRDMYLRLLSKKEPIMAGALYSVVSRIKSLPWNVKGGTINKNYYQDLLANADDGAGFAQFISKVVADLLVQDNGAFIELRGAGNWDKPLKGRVTGIYHLDSHQCWRTFDPEFPVIYTDPLNNTFHRLHRTRVIMLSSNPQPDERARNVGYCAVSRALKMMQIIRNIQTFKDEKISGKFHRALIYGGPLTPKQFKQATETAEVNSENSNFIVYNEIPVLLSTIADLKLSMLDLASLPDGFDYEKEINIYVYILALCFGTDAREFWPATASGATKADASVQHLKAQGKGIADIIKMIETAINWHIMPANGGAEFEYDFTDDEQDKAVADINTVKITNVGLMQTNGNITAQEGRALLIAQGVIDPKQLVLSPDNQIADDSAPMEDDLLANAQPDQTTQADSFDMTVGAQAKYNPDAPTRTPGNFTEDKHPRATDGKFGSGGSTPAASTPVATTPAEPPASPLVNALVAYLKSIKMLGKFKNGRLSVPGDTKDRSADLQANLRANGFPNAVVTGKQTKKGFTYSIKGVTAKKPRATKKGMKAAPVDDHVSQYKKKLEGLMNGFIDKVASNPSSLNSAADDLYSEFIDTLPQELTNAYGVGLAGDDPTDDGIEQLTTTGQTSVDYFKDSFLPALTAVSLVGLAADDIRAALSPFVSRIGLYSGSFWASIWQGQRDATPADVRVKRILHGSDHCDTCPGKEGVYDSYDDMVSQCGGVPGDGSDTCLGNCLCTIEAEGDDGEFGPITGSPTVFTQPLFEVLR